MRLAGLVAVLLASTAGTALAVPPTVDGKITVGDAYGAPLWVNNIPTGFGDNTAGAGSGAPSLGNPREVNTGVEISIPFAAVGYAGSGPITLAAFVGSPGNGSMSNQVLAGLPLNTPNQDTTRVVNFTTFTGNQHLTITPVVLASAPVVDGVRDAVYGGLIISPDPRLQTNYTGYGKSNHNQVVRGGPGTQDGSELDNVYAGVFDGRLYLFFGGNLESNGNNLAVFLDSDNSAATGQNRLLGGNTRLGSPTGAEPLNNISDDGSSNGLTFDTAFGPDYYIGINGSDTDPTPEVEVNTVFIDHGTLPTAGAGAFLHVGSTGYGPGGGGAPVSGDPGAPDIRASVNNSNLNGVAGEPVGGTVTAPNVDFAFGSEIDALYGYVSDGRLNLLVTGNIEKNFNALVLFFDLAAGGQNRLRGVSRSIVTAGSGTVRWRGNVDLDFNKFNNLGPRTSPAEVVEDPGNPGTLIQTAGLQFDPDFAADYAIRVANGDNNNDRLMRNFSNASFLRTGGRSEDLNGNSLDFGAFDGGLKSTFNPIVYGGPRVDDFTGADSQTNYAPRLISAAPQPIFDPTPFSNLLRISIDNSNVAGVTGAAADPVAAAAVTTGVEYSLDLAELGWDGTSPIKVAGFVASGDWSFLSNQVLGGLPAGTGNLGTGRVVNFGAIGLPGDHEKQYVIIPVGTPPGCNLADITEIGGTTENPGVPDGQLTVDDIIVFINAFSDSVGCPGANPPFGPACNVSDVTGIGGPPELPDGQLTVDDIIAFFNAFSDGCL